MEDQDFKFFLKLFHHIMPHVDLLYAKLQKKVIDSVYIQENIQQDSQKIRSVISYLDTPGGDTAEVIGMAQKNPQNLVIIQQQPDFPRLVRNAALLLLQVHHLGAGLQKITFAATFPIFKLKWKTNTNII
ncbi:hypothetical protein MHYP_G00365810 [Metynnis hypsauchen]